MIYTLLPGYLVKPNCSLNMYGGKGLAFGEINYNQAKIFSKEDNQYFLYLGKVRSIKGRVWRNRNDGEHYRFYFLINEEVYYNDFFGSDMLKLFDRPDI